MEQLVARRAHNPKVVGSSPAPATSLITESLNREIEAFCFIAQYRTLIILCDEEFFYFKVNLLLWHGCCMNPATQKLYLNNI
jgi:hypothetical protein